MGFDVFTLRRISVAEYNDLAARVGNSPMTDLNGNGIADHDDEFSSDPAPPPAVPGMNEQQLRRSLHASLLTSQCYMFATYAPRAPATHMPHFSVTPEAAAVIKDYSGFYREPILLLAIKTGERFLYSPIGGYSQELMGCLLYNGEVVQVSLLEGTKIRLSYRYRDAKFVEMVNLETGEKTTTTAGQHWPFSEG